MFLKDRNMLAASIIHGDCSKTVAKKGARESDIQDKRASHSGQ
jgi:hypothetical protein